MLNVLHFLKYHAIVISFKHSFNLIICNLKKKNKSDSEQKRIGTCDILKLPPASIFWTMGPYLIRKNRPHTPYVIFISFSSQKV